MPLCAHSSGSWLPCRMRRPSCYTQRLVPKPTFLPLRKRRRRKAKRWPIRCAARRIPLQPLYGIRTPILSRSEILLPEALDLVLVPCTAFDADCFRVGMGKGYYDRYLPRCKNAVKIGIAFEVQRVEHAAVDEHDQRLDAYVTERGIYKWK